MIKLNDKIDKKNSRNLAKIVVSFMPMVIMMIVIYSFSAKNGVQSSQTSGDTVSVFLTSFEKIFRVHLTEEQRHLISGSMELPVRKMAHMAEYGLLLATIYIPVEINFSIKRNRKAIYSAGVAVLYAASDEFHQLFVPGRSGKVTDVLIDSVGIIVSLLILYTFFKKRDRSSS